MIKSSVNNEIHLECVLFVIKTKLDAKASSLSASVMKEVAAASTTHDKIYFFG
ncbi:hypothetical protein [Candidatus Williamhamiltonella defendens]|uniref:hypothetical protein n=1 Tax=Candidatus Williamhamiltonella defendens TaxID=138072 RepID=UPI001651428E|nr:hypothetical protein [Candidatus Hamiltonella defensa]